MNKTAKVALIAAFSVYVVLASTLIVYKYRISPTNQTVLSADSNYSLDLVNDERKLSGLKPLDWNNDLEKAALGKAVDIFNKDYFAHTAPDGTKAWNFILTEGYSYKYAGENLAVDFDNINDAFEGWKNSPSHLKNIVSDKYEDYALVQKEGVLDGKNTIVFVQLFASK
ncbi:MAG: CAP domain-containing protein [bacterium]